MTEPNIEIKCLPILKHYREPSTPWREVFKKELEEYGEAALMLRESREMENGKGPIGKEMALRFGRLFNTDYRKFL
jgi:hypothetical protein